MPREILEISTRALKRMDFRDAETLCALRVVESHLAESGINPSIETVIREALRVLT